VYNAGGPNAVLRFGYLSAYLYESDLKMLWSLEHLHDLLNREMYQISSENSVRPPALYTIPLLSWESRLSIYCLRGTDSTRFFPFPAILTLLSFVDYEPESLPFCIDSTHPSIQIPLYFNQTKPKHVELLRIDFETNVNETIILSQKEINSARKLGEEAVAVVNYAAKKPGLYRLQKVIDKTKLEVQRRMSDTLVVTCPKAEIRSASSDKCVGDLF